MGATAVTMLRMETMGQRGRPRYFRKRGVSVRDLEHKQERAWPMAAEPNVLALSLALPAKLFRQMGLSELAPCQRFWGQSGLDFFGYRAFGGRRPKPFLRHFKLGTPAGGCPYRAPKQSSNHQRQKGHTI